MNELETRIATALVSKAQSIPTTRSLPRSVARRATRQRAFVSTASLVCVGLATLLFVTLSSPAAERSVAPAGGADAAVNLPAGVVRDEVVAAGTVDGRTWALVAYEDEGAECIDFRASFAVDAAEMCVIGKGGKDPGYEPGGMTLLSSDLAGGSTALYGEAGSTIEALEVRLSTGAELAAELHGAPAAVRDRGRFFVALAPDGVAGKIVATDASGRVVTSRRF